MFQNFTFYCLCCILVNFWAIFAHFTILELSKSYLLNGTQFVWFKHVILSQCYKNPVSFFLNQSLIYKVVGSHFHLFSSTKCKSLHINDANFYKCWVLLFYRHVSYSAFFISAKKGWLKIYEYFTKFSSVVWVD